jgi:hypothetical protein
MDNFKIEAMANTAAGELRYNVFGVSVTHKGQLAMRGTSTDKYAARMRVFARDGDTKVVMVKIGYMAKAEAAQLLAASEEFRNMCVDKQHDWAQVQAFLHKQAGAAVAVIPTIEPKQAAADTVAEEPQPDTAALLEQQEAADEGAALEPEESVEQSRKQRGRRR